MSIKPRPRHSRPAPEKTTRTIHLSSKHPRTKDISSPTMASSFRRTPVKRSLAIATYSSDSQRVLPTAPGLLWHPMRAAFGLVRATPSTNAPRLERPRLVPRCASGSLHGAKRRSLESSRLWRATTRRNSARTRSLPQDASAQMEYSASRSMTALSPPIRCRRRAQIEWSFHEYRRSLSLWFDLL